MAVQKQTIYLETSIISAYFDFKEQDAERKLITRNFWKEIVPSYTVKISAIVVAELEDTPEVHFRKPFLQFVESIDTLSVSPSVMKLAQQYVAECLIPKNKLADASHLAVATVHKIDYLVSWNQKHITAPLQRKKIITFHGKRGLYIPTVTTPNDFLM